MMPILVTAVHPNGFPEELFWLQKAVALGRKKKNKTKGMRYQINRDMDFPFSRN